MVRSHAQNWFATTTTSAVSSSDTTVDVETTGDLTVPCYIVIDPEDSDNREVWYVDGTVTSTRFSISSVSSRYLAGSAKDSGQTHTSGTTVWSVPLQQNVSDLWDTVEANETAVAGKADTGHTHDGRYYTETEIDALVAGRAQIATGSYTGDGSDPRTINVSFDPVFAWVVEEANGIVSASHLPGGSFGAVFISSGAQTSDSANDRPSLASGGFVVTATNLNKPGVDYTYLVLG